jgi:DNA modification methylase
MQLPIHRWFRYSAGFSAEWAGELIRESASRGRLQVLDPFAGSGTVMIEAERTGADAVGLEAHPFVVRVACAKLAWREETSEFRRHGRRILKTAQEITGTADGYPHLIGKCFPPETLTKLDALKKAWHALDDQTSISELCWLSLVTILRSTSPVGTAQWQYVLPRKAKSKAVEPFQAFELQLELMARDMMVRQQEGAGPQSQIHLDDARRCSHVPDQWADLVVTSPPYANNYDYADATRLEMCFFGEITGWGDLQGAVRNRLVRSCTQHVAPYVNRTREVIKSGALAPISTELGEVYARLLAERDKHGGKKPYHAMIVHYFYDLSQVWQSLRRVTKPGGRVCFVIGDSAPYGIYVPVDKWLGELALAAGFKAYRFEKLRDRNTKWKNRKHRVLLQEGRLWVEG